MFIQRTYLALALVACMVSVTTIRDAQAATVTHADVEQCLHTGLGNVLAGKVPAHQYLSLPRIVSRVFGPPARQLTDAGYQEATEFIGHKIQAYISRKRSQFQHHAMEVTTIEAHTRAAHVYRVTGRITVDGTSYHLVVNGLFYSAQKCAVYGISIAKVWSLIGHLRDQRQVRQRCEALTRQQC